MIFERSNTMAKDEKVDEAPRGFAVALQQMDEGCFHAEISETLQKTLGELEQFAIKFGVDARGMLTLALALKVSPTGVVAVSGEIKTKVPKAPRASSVFWLSPGNNLSPENPRQQRLPLREVRGPAAAPREVTDVKQSPRTV